MASIKDDADSYEKELQEKAEEILKHAKNLDDYYRKYYVIEKVKDADYLRQKMIEKIIKGFKGSD